MAIRKKPSRTRKAAGAKRPAPRKQATKKRATKKVSAKPRRKAPAKRAAKAPAKAPAKAAARKPSRRSPARAPKRVAPPSPEPAANALAPDPDGFFVARVRGEEEARHAPHPMTGAPAEGASRWVEPPRGWEGSRPVLPVHEESLGELPAAYGDDAFIALPRDPRTLFFYWDLSAGTVQSAFAGLDGPRAQLWILARQGEGWERVRTIDFAIESRSYYVNDLEPGRTYRGEIQAVDRHGYARRVGASSNATGLPPVGPSQAVDDRFARIPWELPLPRLLGRGEEGGPFSEDLRALLARLSDWGRFPDRPWGGSVAGGARPSSPEFAPSFFPDDSSSRDEKK
ncbi:MAG TPA: DUF4912 domain-containing protein [Anaeromyxobacteraceae bacterium]|nr:DUF4912 domain-containing protein [Anaeromyxobacteraceae bacterium]